MNQADAAVLPKSLQCAETASEDFWRKWESQKAAQGSVTADEVAKFVRLNRARALRKTSSTFFTGDELATKLWSKDLAGLQAKSVVFDPAVGAGSLLLLPLKHFVDMARTSGQPAGTLAGADVDADFAVLASQQLQDAGADMIISTRIVTADFLETVGEVPQASHVVINPPFHAIALGKDQAWSSGETSAAAIFVLRALQVMSSGARLLAILPDVLRSGSRYERWRSEVATLAPDIEVEIQNQFDPHTDIHVFILRATRGRDSASATRDPWLLNSSDSDADTDTDRLSTICEVSVGAVVPHRHAEEGPSLPFLDARSLSVIENDLGDIGHRQFSGRVETGPFIALRRTSRPEDVPRLRPVLINDFRQYAVENHIVIVKLKAGAGAIGYPALIEILSSTLTTEFLSGRMRCRHITTRAIKDVPVPMQPKMAP